MSAPRARIGTVRRPAVVLVAAVCLLSCGRPLPDAARVRRVIDGDTVELVGAQLVRYLGIDAPEVRRRARPGDREWRTGDGERWVVDPEPMGREATEFNRRLVEGKRVRLEYDVQTHDRFGRLLAYVYVSAEGDHVGGAGEVMVNTELLRAGFAQPLTIPPNARYADRFRALTEEARTAQRGLWGRR